MNADMLTGQRHRLKGEVRTQMTPKPQSTFRELTVEGRSMLHASWRSIVVATIFSAGLCAPLLAQTTTDEAKKAGQATEQAGKDAGDAAAHAGKAVAKGTKNAAKKAKHAVTPNTTSAECKDGTVQTGKTKTTACDDHGGVK